MSSNLACIGLAVADDHELGQLIDSIRPSAHTLGVFDGVTVQRWQDDTGSTLVMAWKNRQLVDLLPTFAGASGGQLAGMALINGSVASAAVVDEDGEQVTALTFDAEDYRQMIPSGPISGFARITSLGVAVTIHADAETFAASRDSLLEPNQSNDPPPSHYVEQGWAWPPRMAAESFISYGVFADPAASTAHARLSGTVLRARHHTNALTGQGFTAATVRTVGFETELCLADADHTAVVEPGSVISGTVYLTAGRIAPK